MATRQTFLRCFMFLIITVISHGSTVATAVEDQFLDVGALTPKIHLRKIDAFVGELSVGFVGHFPCSPWTAPYNNGTVEPPRPRCRVPVLPLANETQQPPKFNFVLKTNEHQISLKIRSDNLRPIGYQMQTPSKWLEFDTESGKHLIPGAEFLGFRASYRSLEDAARTKITDVPCSKPDFINAINQLAVTFDTATRAKSSILILQFIVESARYRDVRYLLASNFDNPSARIEPYMVDPLAKNWEELSTMVIKANYDECYKFVPPLIQGNEPDTLEKLSSRFGILYRDPSTLKPPCTFTAPLHDATRKIEL